VATPPQGDSGAVAEAARLLVNAQNPVIVADRVARTPAGMALLIELAETLQASSPDHRVYVMAAVRERHFRQRA
jgi:thiamine pyrophosphate-dependent acetolactate synthase large subunit-like protein